MVVVMMTVSLLALSLPAYSHDDPCPPGWTLFFDPMGIFADKDKNGDGSVCVKMVPGEGNTQEDPDVIDNVVVKDDHEHQN
jgi:hypothetical protein